MDKITKAPIIIGKLMNIGGLLQKMGNQMLQPFELNQQQYSILFSVFEEKRVNQKSMVNKLLLEKAHVSKVVKKLNSLQLIEIEASKEDRRSSWLSITEKGRRTVEECQRILQEWNEEWVHELDEEQLQNLLESTAILQALFKKQFDKL